MAVSNVHGLEVFREYMEGFEDCYAVIGGTACDIIMRDADLDFRATKDIDVILLIEHRFPEVGRAVWRLVEDGGYRCGWKGSEKAHFYRFTEPEEPGFPVMVELFSKTPDFLDGAEGLVVAPLPVDDDVSSLSAILLDDDYYEFMRGGRVTVDGVTVIDETRLIPFKAKAYLDLSERKARGEHVNTGDLRKHKKDVFRLVQILDRGRAIGLPPAIKADMEEFCSRAGDEGAPLAQMGLPMTLDEAIAVLESAYGLG